MGDVAKGWTWAALALPLLAASCGGSGGGMACTQASTSDLLPSGTGSWSVSYTASATGTGSLSSVQYADATGTIQTVPVSGTLFTKSLSIPGGMSVSLAANGSPGNGTLNVDITSTQSGTEREVSNSCGGS